MVNYCNINFKKSIQFGLVDSDNFILFHDIDIYFI